MDMLSIYDGAKLVKYAIDFQAKKIPNPLTTTTIPIYGGSLLQSKYDAESTASISFLCVSLRYIIQQVCTYQINVLSLVELVD